MHALLEMREVDKNFAGVRALNKAEITLQAGEVHGLLGENGAGKSTLMKILAGIYPADHGKIFINGQEVAINSVQESHQAGVSIIHQELVLVPYMTVAENIFSGREPTNRLGLLDKDKMNADARELIRSFGLKIEPTAVVGRLNIAEQQLVEIIKAISYDAKILVMDEPSSSLTEKEVEFLFKTIRQLKAKGVGIIYISHRMYELFTITDCITVMRDGKYIGTKVTKETNLNELISMMVGRELTDYYTRTYHELGDEVLEVKNLTRKGVFQNVNFSLRRGEILGFAGLVGAGRSEVMKAIFGLDSFDSGEILIEHRPIKIRRPADAMRAGIAFVPENRKQEGLILKQTVGYNLTLRVLKEFIYGCFVNRARENQIINEHVKKLAIKTTGGEQMVINLSGGNQQKVVIAKWLASKPKILILDEPTRGVDVNAKAEIYAIMNQLILSGVSIIMISSELPEVINMSDRIAVISNGEITGILNREEFSQEKIMHLATAKY